MIVLRRPSVFYERLEGEVKQALVDNCLVLIECDANAKLGPEVIKNDPHPQSENGSCLWSLVQRNNLVVVNSSSLCEGVITRHRTTKIGEEKSVLDYVIVCERLNTHVNKMVIDEGRCDVLTKYATKKGREKLVESDHNLLSCTFNIKHKSQITRERVEVFNYKDAVGQKRFFEETSKDTLVRCFDPRSDIETNANRFHKTLEKIVRKCFKKVRITPKRDTVLDEKLKNRDELKVRTTNNPGDSNAKKDLENVEEEIKQYCAMENAEVIRKQVKNLSNLDGGFSSTGMWKIKKKVMRKQAEPPMAKRDNKGNLVTSPKMLKQLYLDEYIHRLRHRDINPGLQTLKQMKDDLWERRFNLLKERKSSDWTADQVNTVLTTLKTNKARDPLGFSNDIFQPGVCGVGLLNAVTMLANGVKNAVHTPEIMKLNDISTIYKNKGSRLDLVNDRGIFNMVTFRKVVDKLIYNDKYEAIDVNMSDSNVGGRKGKNIRNHLFIVYGVINSVMNQESPPVDLQFYDLKQCFDAMWLEESMNNLCDTIDECEWDDKLALIYQNNSDNLVAVKTPFGLTDRVSIRNIVTQGGVWGPIQCSNQVDGIGKECVARNIHLYTYKNKVKVMPLAMIDDVLALALCGIKSVAVNTFINSKMEMRKLVFSDTKCKKVHAGKCNPFCPDLEAHKNVIEGATQEKYLGDIIGDTIMGDGCNSKNIKNRRSKGMGIITEVMTILNNVSLGYFLFDTARMLRDSMLVNGIMFNCEVWYGLTSKQMAELENIDRLLLRRVLDTPISTPIEALYLELGLIPVHLILKGRRLMFLHYLLQLREDEMLSQFFYAQWECPARNDWVLTVQQDILDLQVGMNLREIQLCTKDSFKTLITERCEDAALNYLMVLKEGHSKMTNLTYHRLELQPYFCAFNSYDAKLMFQFRTRMVHVASNYKNNSDSLLCPLCNTGNDDQRHLLQCHVLHPEGPTRVNYDDIFGNDTNAMKVVFDVLKSSWLLREKIMEVTEIEQ